MTARLTRCAGVSSLLEAISRAIDSWTKREPGEFSPSPAEASERTIYGNGENYLAVPEHITGTVHRINLSLSVVVDLS